MTRNHYNMIIRGIRSIIEEALEPFMGQTVTVRVAAMISDEMNAMNAALLEVVQCLNSDERPYIEDEDEDEEDDDEHLFAVDEAFQAAMEASDDDDEPSEAEPASVRSEYEAFVANLRNKKMH